MGKGTQVLKQLTEFVALQDKSRLKFFLLNLPSLSHILPLSSFYIPSKQDNLFHPSWYWEAGPGQKESSYGPQSGYRSND